MNTAPAIQIDGLTKRYGTVTAVSDLYLRVPAGCVYGFIGPNGAGKTTVMRMLLGLVRPSAGTGRLLGRPLGDPAALRRTGSLIEGPAFYPYLSGRRNLALLARYLGVPPAQVDRTLELVALERAADTRFHRYSLGMKQRLGVAAALLGDPDLLILDEPANGLDPAGVTAMRDMIRALGGTGRTVLLSSHLLDEVAQVCDRVAVLHEGRLVADGTLDEIRGTQGGAPRLLVRAEPLGLAAQRLRGLPEVTAVEPVAGRLEVTADPGATSAIIRTLVEAGVAVHEVSVAGPSLERVFLTLTASRHAEVNS